MYLQCTSGVIWGFKRPKFQSYAGAPAGSKPRYFPDYSFGGFDIFQRNHKKAVALLESQILLAGVYGRG